MGKETGISWTDHTFNPWWGCQRVSEACRNCYAETMGHRFGVDWGPNTPRRFFADKHWNEPRAWDRKARTELTRRRVFCASMADVFENRRDLDPHRMRLWDLIQHTTSLDWLLLTKRPEMFAEMLPWMRMTERGAVPVMAPWSMVWLGVTAEDNQRAEERILTLRATPAAVRFVSCEPVLEDIGADTWDLVLGPREGLGPIHWLIIGDESGTGRRGASVEWIRTARDAAARHNVAFHFKQWCGGPANGIAELVEIPNVFAEGETVMTRRAAGRDKVHLPILDGIQHSAFPELP